MSASEEAKVIAASIKTVDEQRELFLWKYRDVRRHCRIHITRFHI